MFEGQPRGLFALALANTGERFGYYTMLAVFVLFLQENFGWSAGLAGTNGSTTIAEGYSQKHVTKEHDADADFHHFAISKFVGKDTANKWQEVNEHQEC